MRIKVYFILRNIYIYIFFCVGGRRFAGVLARLWKTCRSSGLNFAPASRIIYTPAISSSRILQAISEETPYSRYSQGLEDILDSLLSISGDERAKYICIYILGIYGAGTLYISLLSYLEPHPVTPLDTLVEIFFFFSTIQKTV